MSGHRVLCRDEFIDIEQKIAFVKMLLHICFRNNSLFFDECFMLRIIDDLGSSDLLLFYTSKLVCFSEIVCSDSTIRELSMESHDPFTERHACLFDQSLLRNDKSILLRGELFLSLDVLLFFQNTTSTHSSNSLLFFKILLIF